MPGTAFIYSLHDPQTGHLRYVGHTMNLKRRLTKHVSKSLVGKDFCHRANWVRSVCVLGERPIQFLIAEVPEGEKLFWETFYIKRARDLGFSLVNGSDGGEGWTNPTPEVRAKISKRFKGIPLSEAHRAKLSEAAKRRERSPMSEETKAKIAAKAMGNTRNLGKKRKPYNYKKEGSLCSF